MSVIARFSKLCSIMNAYLLELLTYLFRCVLIKCNASLHFGSSKHSSNSKKPPSLTFYSAISHAISFPIILLLLRHAVCFLFGPLTSICPGMSLRWGIIQWFSKSFNANCKGSFSPFLRIRLNASDYQHSMCIRCVPRFLPSCFQN